MACACKVNQQIDYLHKKYGTKVPVSKKTQISFHIGEAFKKLLIGILTLPLTIVMLIHVLFKAFSKNKVININRLLRLKHV